MSLMNSNADFATDAPSTVFLTAAARWEAVTRRDPRADGAFLYAVRTTGIYCRPTCHARLPRRENVSFYESSTGAERAGFRPCKRCAPQLPAPTEPHAAAIARARRRLDTSTEGAPTLTELAAEAGLSPFHFQRVFKRLTGLSPKQYAIAGRERRLRATLERGQPVTAAVYDAGYGSASRAYEDAPATLGMTPGAYRSGAAGEVVRYDIATCSLGHVLVAATERGLCAIEFGDDDHALLSRLTARFPRARLERGGTEIEKALAAVTQLIDSPQSGPPSLPLDVRGTAFQRRVWEALRAIPAGVTVTYSGLAAQLGQPRAARAVAQACGANTL
ncbi:MAG TPA: bifunctional DNA-binding transcriptional regulator/O6-methylguanine-DNA methyltransferase Ada, partial [Chloroflexota bacterium]|nr:bifunctional DNA-binding transcriptional regulator/O6-methylguanine-DNA methyltransferase Ada [Chloroflexota bacterium]